MRMKSAFAVTVAMMALAGSASAQTASAQTTTPSPLGYVEFQGQSAWGNVTTQSYGAAGGMQVTSTLQAFVEVGWTRDVASDATRQAAGLIAAFLSQTQGSTAYTAKESAGFAAGGIRFPLHLHGSSLGGLTPYVEAGAGWAHLTKKTTFSVGGGDVTSTLADLGVQLGADLAGSRNAGMMVLGGGAVWPVWRQVIFDFNYRYSKIFASPDRITLNRAGLGLGITF
jgi:opacity protein-like surface antigen